MWVFFHNDILEHLPSWEQTEHTGVPMSAGERGAHNAATDTYRLTK